LLDINDLIGEALALTRGDLQRHRILVQAEPNGRVPQVRGDRIQLQQVLLNLITNAVDSMAAKDGARVLCVRSEVRDGGGVIVSVADTGTGIGSQELERIFNPLFTTKSGGLGMGLSICRSIVEAHDGRLWVVPNKPEGAVFQLMLLADDATSAGASRREQPEDLLASSRRRLGIRRHRHRTRCRARVSECRPKSMKQSSCAAFGLAVKLPAEAATA
jgi:signal transduction histidine kinase